MNLFDVNVLIHAFRRDADRHAEYRAWLLAQINGDSALGLSDLTLAALIRITTHPRAFVQPSPRDEAVAFVDALRRHPLCRRVRPGDRHFGLFLSLLEQADARGNLVTDAWYAALAIEAGCTWITTDRDFARFPGLRWRHPLDHNHDVVNPA